MERKNGCLWFVLPDVINMDNYIRIEEQLQMSLDGQEKKIVIDLTHTKNLFSSGLGLLIRLKKHIDNATGSMFLVNVSKKIRDLLAAVNLDKLFFVYATDVEFEISQEDVLASKRGAKPTGFVFADCVEKGVYRITMSGNCAMGQETARLAAFKPDAKIKQYVFDLTGLDLLDTAGIKLLSHLFAKIRDIGGTALAYGGDGYTKELLGILGLSEIVRFCDNEREAMEAIGKV
jgi:anti-anti-sigma factor